MTEPLAFIRDLTVGNPYLALLLERHLAEYGAPLAHVFMGGVSRYVSEQHHRLQSGDPAAKAVLSALFARVEEAASRGGEDLKELISVSFLENLASEFVDDPDFRAFLGPRLKEELEPILRSYGYPGDATHA